MFRVSISSKQESAGKSGIFVKVLSKDVFDVEAAPYTVHFHGSVNH